jgi:hypothetical protein
MRIIIPMLTDLKILLKLKDINAIKYSLGCSSAYWKMQIPN